MAYTSTSFMFRSLSDEEEEAFREYARKNNPDMSKWEIMHPVCREEWEKQGFGPEAKEIELSAS